MKRPVLYCRVSTAQQEKEETIEMQQLKLKDIYQEQNIIKEYLDNGFSGGSLDRPAMNQLREDAKRGLFDVVAVYSLSRLSRKAYHQIKLREEFKKLGITIEVLGKDIGDDNRFGRMGNSVMGLFYEFERDDITEKMKDGKFKLAGKGNLVGCNAPYGYTLKRRDRLNNTMAEFIVNPIEAKGVKEIFNVYKERQSLRLTIRELARKGIFGKNGKPFIKKTLTRILSNEIYIGNFYWGKCACHKDDETKVVARILKPKSEWKLIKVPAEIDETTFRQVQDILQYRKKAYIFPTKNNYLCQGLVRCKDCGRLYNCKPATKAYTKNNGEVVRYFKYVCPNKFQPDEGVSKCRSKGMEVKKLDGIVWNYIKDLISNPERVKREAKIVKEKRDKDKGKYEKEYDLLQTEKAKLKVKRLKLLDMYISSNFKKEDIDEQVLILNKQEDVFDRELKDVEKNLCKIEDLKSTEREIEKICLAYKTKIENADFETKKKIIKYWVEEINILESGKYTTARINIKVNIPDLDEALKIKMVEYTQLSRAMTIPQTDLAPASSNCEAHSCIVKPVV